MKRILLVLLLSVLASPAEAERLISTDKALKKVYKKADQFEQIVVTLSQEQVQSIEDSARLSFSNGHSNRLTVHSVYQSGQLIGHALEDTVFGKWGPIHYLVGLDLSGKVKKTIILSYDEIRGKAVAKNRYLKQYKGKTVKSKLRLRKDIKGLSGATISSRSLTDGVRKLLHVYELIKSGNFAMLKDS